MFFESACHVITSTGARNAPTRPTMRPARAFNTPAALLSHLIEALLILSTVGLLATALWALSGEESAMAAIVRALQPPLFHSDMVEELLNLLQPEAGAGSN